MEKNKLWIKILGIVVLIGGFILTGFGLVDFIKVTIANSGKVIGDTTRETMNMWYPLLATPVLFSGFFLVILGFGKKKNNEQR